ncbi:response regulator [Legionella sp. CNM-1927-20]|uniref:response regulator n=1 Tax=Legionella sp. CNM-1927-20 TaxID=3422221 RepID=UPI00403A8DED
MRVLVVEDSTFNAFCLTRLLQVVYTQINVTVVNDSVQALAYLQNNVPALIILDGDLKASDGLECNGPALAHTIWSSYKYIPIIAWTNSEIMRQAFADVFRQHNKPFHDYHCWQKIVSLERIAQSLSYLIKQEQNFAKEQINLEHLYI